jgi:alkanesulfonate monooxygenase SsuD/methylene tetrahydromethanopterin reductase-like flavin-dependent oxidoreductase (luciferase family)
MTAPLSFQLRPTESFASTVEYAQLADELGYDTIMCSHIAARDSFTTLAALAQHTQRVRLATAVAPIYHRSPASMAQTAATVDDASAGRFILGLGTGHRVTMGGWHGQEIGKPVPEMREYLAVVRAILAGEAPPEGERWRSNFAFVGFTPRPDIPVYLAGLSPAMLRLAGELADGVILDSVGTAEEVRTARELLAEGRAAAGRDGATRVTVFTELEVAGGSLKERMAERAAMLGQAGADSVVFHASGDQPDPGPHIEALAPEHPHTGAAHPVGYCPVTPDGGGPRV